MRERLGLLNPLLPWSKMERVGHAHIHLAAMYEESEDSPSSQQAGTQALEQPLLATKLIV